MTYYDAINYVYYVMDMPYFTLWSDGISAVLCMNICTSGRQPFPSRGPKTNSARYGGLY